MIDKTTPTRQPEGDAKPADADAETSGPGGAGLGLGVLLLLVAAAVGFALYHFWGFWRPPQTAAAPPPPTVTVAKPLVRDLIEWNEFTGQFQAVDSVDVRARVSGYLESIHFTDGQLVKKGDLLFVIEPRPFELALASAKANLAQAKANLDLAKSQLNRTVQLREKDFAAQETLDERQATVETAIATVQSAEAALEQAQLNLDYTHVVAPISGRVSRHEVSVGNLVLGGINGSSTTLLTNIVSLDPIHLVFNVSEADGIAYKERVRRGEIPSARDGKVEVEGQLMNQDQWTLHGAIDFVDNQYDPSAGTIVVRARFPNPGMFITPGQFGRVRVPISKKRPTLLVPDEAIVTDQASKLLYVVDKDGKVSAKTVDLGPTVGDNLRVVHSGITANDEIVVDGLMRARPGATVTPQQSQIDPARAPKESDSEIDPGQASK
jgi:RND family efflux transporter MFP subunit